MNARGDDLIDDQVEVDTLSAEFDDSFARATELLNSVGKRIATVLETLEEDQPTEIARTVSRMELHGKRKRFFGLF